MIESLLAKQKNKKILKINQIKNSHLFT